MTRYKTVLEYDGTGFLGFQRQAQGRTVQGEIENGLRRMGWAGKTIWGAGRTDTGVHAAGQVIAFDLDWAHGEPALLRALNANLPADVSVQSVAGCAPEFHPRYDAQARRYRYTIYNAPSRSALKARFSWHVPQPLAQPDMQRAAGLLLGTHDFATFGTDPDDGNNTVRTVTVAAWSRSDTAMIFDIQAEAFLFRMVRGIVGALKQVGAGEMALAEFERVFDARDRAQCPPLAPAHGLCLIEVVYP
jgi:tRNA pseudouridine38-40 synthase